MKKNNSLSFFLICLAIISISELMQAQCATANAQQHRGGAISCNFPFLSTSDVDYYTSKLQSIDLENWYEEKSELAQKTSRQWKTKNLRILMLTNHADIISNQQLEKLKMAMNLHLIEIANANKNDYLEWAHMPIVEEIIIQEYPEDLSSIFDVVGYLVFSDPDQRNGETQLNKFVREIVQENDINTIVNLMDAPLDIPFTGAAQIYCNDPGEYMTVSIKKNNTISLLDKYLVQFAQACVHTIGHTNFANHQKGLSDEETTLLCLDHNHAQNQDFETMMVNGLKEQKMRIHKSKAYGNSWSEGNAQQIINTYIQRGLLLPLFEYNNQPIEENADDTIIDDITLFPNPAAEILTIEVSNDSFYDLTVYNVNGKLIQNQTLESFVTELDVSNYDSGIYIFEFFCANSGKRVTKKVEKIK